MNKKSILKRINLEKVKKEHINNSVVKKVKPLNFLRKERIDIVPKYLYVEDKAFGINSEYHKELYLNHIKAFNNFNENDGRGKTNKEKFVKEFDSIVDSIESSGFDPSNSIIPVSKGGIILDGSHRIATALYHKKDVHFIDTLSESPHYDISFFKKRGMSSEDIESILLNYSMIQKDIYVAILWGSAPFKNDKVREILNQSKSNLLYDKKIDLTKRGMKNIIINCYEGQDWMGNASMGHPGHFSKMKECFKGKPEVKIFIFEADSIKTVLKLKNKVRNLFDMGKHSIHISDNQKESVHLLKIFLNKNSLHHLNFSDMKKLKKFDNLLSDFKKNLKSHGINEKNVCVVSSAVLSSYGIRDCRDLDYIIIGRDKAKIKEMWEDTHNSYFEAKELSELITNPANHFYFGGIKFLELNKMLSFKKKRGEGKDRRDLDLAKFYFSDKGDFLWEIKKNLNKAKIGVFDNYMNTRLKIARSISKYMSEDLKSYLKKYIKI